MNRFVKGNSITCIGCRTCMIGCVVAHEGIKIFQMHPDEYVFSPKLDIVKTDTISIAVQCKHCENASCLNSCPVDAISRIDDAVIINTSKCIGCKTCMLACPYGAINMVKASDRALQTDNCERMVANKCDLCVNDKNGPTCVRVCPTKSLTLVTEEAMTASITNKRVNAARGLSTVNG